MFQEDCCLQCGKPCVDGHVYCSPACEQLDAEPSLSSSSHSPPSSAFSSPYLPSTLSSLSLASAHIPPLSLDGPRPSATSSAATVAAKPHHHQQTMWYDSDEDPALDADPTGPGAVAGTIRVANHSAGLPHAQLIYARRPSSTNNRSTIPLLSAHKHRPDTRRASSSTTTATSDSLPSTPADEPLSHHRPPQPHSHSPHVSPASSTATATAAASASASAARKRANRASLPAHFSLLASPPLRPSSTRAWNAAPVSIPPLALSPTGGAATGLPPLSTPKLARPAVDATPALAGASPSSAPLTSCAAPFAYARLRGHERGRRSDHRDRDRDRDDEEEPRGRRRVPGSGSRARAGSRSRRRERSGSRSGSRLAGRDEVRGRRRPAAGEGWLGTTDHGFGFGRTGLMAREVPERGRDR